MIRRMSCSITSRPQPKSSRIARERADELVATRPRSSPAAGSSSSRKAARAASARAIAEPPLVAVRQRAGAHAGPVARAEALEQLARAAAAPRAADAPARPRRLDVLGTRQAREQPDVLERPDEPGARDPCGAQARDVVAVEQHARRSWRAGSRRAR